MKGFSFKEKLAHYTAIANGTASVKSDSKFSEAEQRAYARGVRDQMNDSRRVFKYKNSTPEERQAYRDKQIIKRAEYLKKTGRGK